MVLGLQLLIIAFSSITRFLVGARALEHIFFPSTPFTLANFHSTHPLIFNQDLALYLGPAYELKTSAGKLMNLD
jgi:hypothetical protein